MSEPPRRQVSEGRKTAYYVGLGLVVVGALLFASTFLSAAMHFGDFNNFEARGQSMALRAVGGMFLIIVGGVICTVGARGLAGSGVMLDPQEARKDLEPWARMGGELVNDTLSEIEPIQKVVNKLTSDSPPPQEVIKLRCRKCGALNNEHAHFCDQCAAEL